MNCPDEIADILLRVLQRGVVSARAAGWSNHLELATLEADHVHNLPELIRRYDPEKLVYYWDRERPSYVSQCTRLTSQEPKSFADFWEQLEALMPAVRETLPPTSTFHATMEEIIRSVATDHKDQ